MTDNRTIQERLRAAVFVSMVTARQAADLIDAYEAEIARLRSLVEAGSVTNETVDQQDDTK